MFLRAFFSCLFSVTLAAALLLLLSRCTADELPVPVDCESGSATYELNIQPIIDGSCSYAGCHDGNSPGVPGNFTTYEGMLPLLDNGAVRTRVIDLRDDPVVGMPPNASTYPQSRKDDLTPEEFELMRCWLDNGHPAN